jgi:hypothetical protein
MNTRPEQQNTDINAVEALRGLVASCTRTPVNCGDGDTHIVSAPTHAALKTAIDALASHPTKAPSPLTSEIVSDLNNITRAFEDEGDRTYLGSTNDADRLIEIAQLFDDWRSEQSDALEAPSPVAGDAVERVA